MRLIVDLRQILEVEVRIDLSAGDARVTEHFLDCAQIARRLKQVRGEGMAQHVRVHMPAETALDCPLRETLLDRARGDAALLEFTERFDGAELSADQLPVSQAELFSAAVQVDDWGVDLAYSGTQKCLSCPPGLAPVTFGERALAALDGRTKPVQSWYLDLSLIRKYLGADRAYHHTAPISMNYALREALALVAEEGLENRIARHAENGRALHAGLAAMGLSLATVDGTGMRPTA